MSADETRSGWDRRREALLGRYEQVALELFAKRGFREVTMDEVADAIGVSGRTLFRYFATKEDVLLGLPRRRLEVKISRIACLQPGDRPFEAAWACLLDASDERSSALVQMTLWRTAARDVPEVVARVRGERIEALIVALTAYFTRALDVDPQSDVRPRLLAGVLAGGEMAVAESLTRSRLSQQELFMAAKAIMNCLGESVSEVEP
ncbi:TetR/AcrR family transcriptional regulator [Acidiferrimicrobium sp. IK]|uniref:TetR/AcrR family transcriptional regulator n=1 Tax=Acidiferrimicrobium sp. IK TaxID=2871700 RepID=UPI0021CB215A|nr:TetR/AcrR family transcriptional regulator [Acidiferrimicrobium sp. IK]MCU4186803.1 TetR/AcrR family transcriptional regulator [Acidiferrimicrobium sp. IK]